MPRANPYRPSLNAGELSPAMAARVDFQKYINAAATLENMVPLVQGGITVRPGTRFIAETKDSARTSRLVAFEFSVEQAYIIEFGHLYCRFYKDDGQIVDGGAPYEIATPYAEEELGDLRFTQSADTLYIVHRDHRPRTLTRTDHTAWVLEVIDFERGPFLDENGTDLTLNPSATTGSIAITASGPVFQPGHVGAFFELRLPVDANVRSYQAGNNKGSAYSIGTVYHHNGNYYRLIAKDVDNDNAGPNSPTHTEGTRSDGNWRWLYVHSGKGWVRITGYSSATQVTAEVQPINDATDPILPFSGPTTLWSEGAWSDVQGYPEVVAFHEQRLWFGRGQTLWASQSADFTNFEAGAKDADALIYTLSSDRVNRIRWLVSSAILVAGTAGGEWVIRSSTLDEPITPTNVQVKRQTTLGSNSVPPVQSDAAILFIQRHGRKLHELAYSADRDGFMAPDLTLLAGHVTEGGIVDMVLQQEPHRIVHCVRADGTLACLTYQRPEDVVAWCRWITEGAVEQATSIPGPEQDELWLLVRRSVGGTERRYVERLEPFRHCAPEDAVVLDCALTYDGGDDDPGHRLRLDGTAWASGSDATLTAIGFQPFSGGDDGTSYRLTLPCETGGRDIALVEITAVVSGTEVAVRLLNDVPESLRGVETPDWQRRASVLTGLDHLEGCSVAILSDGAPHPARIVEAGRDHARRAGRQGACRARLPRRLPLAQARRRGGDGNGGRADDAHPASGPGAARHARSQLRDGHCAPDRDPLAPAG